MSPQTPMEGVAADRTDMCDGDKIIFYPKSFSYSLPSLLILSTPLITTLCKVSMTEGNVSSVVNNPLHFKIIKKPEK